MRDKSSLNRNIIQQSTVELTPLLGSSILGSFQLDFNLLHN